MVAQIIDEPNGLRLIELLLTYMAKAVPDMTQDTLRQFGQMAGLDPEIVEGSLAWKWLQEGREEGVARVIRQFQRRLGRELAATECALLRDRLNTAGDEVADIVLDFTREESRLGWRSRLRGSDTKARIWTPLLAPLEQPEEHRSHHHQQQRRSPAKQGILEPKDLP